MTRDDQIRQDTVHATIAAPELRMQELLAKLDTATRLRLLDADQPGDWPKPDRDTRGC